MEPNWYMDLLGWGALVVVLLITAAAVTYLVRSWGRRGSRARADRAELEQLRAERGERP